MVKKIRPEDRLYEKNPLLWMSVDLVILFLALLTLIFFLRQTFEQLSYEENESIIAWDTLICVIFIGEYLVRSFLSKSWHGYFKGNWFDLLGSIPVQLLEWGPLNVLRLLRLLRFVSVTNRLLRTKDTSRKIKESSVLAYTGIIVIGVILLCAITVFWLESDINPSFAQFTDSLWWSFVTVTTVGYGDIVPVTEAGRAISVILMFTAIGLISSLAGSLASVIIGDRSADEKQNNKKEGIDSGIHKTIVKGDIEFSPYLDIINTEDNVIVIADVPGAKKENINVSISYNMLEIKINLERKLHEQTIKDNILTRERNYIRFYRKVPLPCPVDDSHTIAKLDDGVLEIILPKSKIVEKKKQIKIN